MKVPEGFCYEDHLSSLVVLRKDCADELRPLLVTPPWEQADRFDGLPHHIGRAAIPSVPLSQGRRVILRTYRHGGLLRGLTQDLYIGLLPRPFRELAVSERARLRGVLTPPVLGAAVYPVIGPIYRGVIAVQELEDARDGLAVLDQVENLRPRLRRQLFRELLTVAGQSVAKAHSAGLVHTDLNVKNLTVTPEPLSVFILDLDRCRLEKRAIDHRQRRSQLRRLHRSLLKTQRLHHLSPLTGPELMLFLKGYCDEANMSLKAFHQFLERWF